MFLAVPVIGVVATTWRTVLRVLGSEPEDDAGGEATPAALADGPADTPVPTTDALGPAAT
jgi:hypothetical protein